MKAAVLGRLSFLKMVKTAIQKMIHVTNPKARSAAVNGLWTSFIRLEVSRRGAVVMTEIFIRDQVGLHHDADIRRIELRVDHRAVAEEPTHAQIALDQRRQGG